MRRRSFATLALVGALVGCGKSGATAAPSGPVDGTLTFRNRMRRPAGYAELQVAGTNTVLPILGVDSITSVDFTAAVGTPLVLKWLGGEVVHVDTIGTVTRGMAGGVEYALTEAGVIKVDG